jgi:chromosome segregation ATPase
METRRFESSSLINIPDLVSLGLQVAAVQEVLRGTFNDELKKIADGRAAITADTAKLGELKTAAINEANDIITKAKGEAATAINAVDARARELDSKANDLASREAKLATDRSAHEAQAAVTTKNLDTRATALDTRESALAAGEAALTKAKTAHEANVAAFNKRLDSLKVGS